MSKPLTDKQVSVLRELVSSMAKEIRNGGYDRSKDMADLLSDLASSDNILNDVTVNEVSHEIVNRLFMTPKASAEPMGLPTLARVIKLKKNGIYYEMAGIEGDPEKKDSVVKWEMANEVDQEQWEHGLGFGPGWVRLKKSLWILSSINTGEVTKA